MHRRGVAMGQEFRGKGVNIAMGPATNMLRAPAAGRNWEGFGPDPYLAGVAMYETTHGMTEQGVIATAKHFIANEQEHYRGGVTSRQQGSSSNLDDRTMHEIYVSASTRLNQAASFEQYIFVADVCLLLQLWPFAESIRGGAGGVMCAFNE